MSKVKFNVEFTDEDTVSADINGKANELINLLCNVLDGNEDLQMVFDIALSAVRVRQDQDEPETDGPSGDA